MGTPQKFKFYLLDSAGQYYYVDNTGNVSTTANETHLRNSPANWRELELKYGRDNKSMGIFRSATTEILFIKDAAKILRHIYYQGSGANFDAYCQFVIKRRIDDDPLRVWQYEDFYRAEVDFANSVNDGVNETGDFFQANTLERGLPELLKDKMNTPLEISLADGVTINLDGKKLEALYTFGQTEWESQNRAATQLFYLPVFTLKQDDAYHMGMYNAVTPESGGVDFDQKACFVAYRDFEGEIRLNTRIDYHAEAGNDADIQLFIDVYIFRDGNFVTPVNSASKQIYSDPNNLTPGSSRVLNIQATYNYSFQQGDHICIVVGMNRGNSNEQLFDVFTRPGDIVIYGVHRLPATTTPSHRYDVFVKKAFEKAFGTQYQVLSTFLSKSVPLGSLQSGNIWNNLPSITYVTSGHAIRGFDNPVIKTTLLDIFQDMWSRWMVSYSVRPSNTNQLHIEQLPYFFYKSSIIATIQEIKSFKKYTATEFIYNQVKAGYPDVSYDKINGQYEFNTEVAYKIPVQRISKQLDLQSSFRADVYGIEYIRAEVTRDEKKDSQEDNDTFLVECDPQPVAGKLNLLRYSTSQVMNVFSRDTHYNWGLMPQFAMYRWRPYFKSILNSPDSATGINPKIEFQSAKKNASQQVVINNVFVPGNGAIPVAYPADGTAPQQIFKPLIFEFECSPNENLIKLIQAKPFGVIQFYDNSNLYAGFILDVGVKIGSRETYTFRLLASPTNDTTALIE